mgnify:FL=1
MAQAGPAPQIGMQLDHFNIAAPLDLLETVRDFYVDVLGFEDGPRPDFSRPGYWLYAAGQAVIHLIEDTARKPHSEPGFLDHIAFRSAGLPAMIERLESHGVTFRQSRVPGRNMAQLFVTDPAGTGLEINFPGEGEKPGSE